jgi:hypothetical protein
MRGRGAGAVRFALTTVATAVVLVAAGAVFAAATGRGTRASVASALFIGAAVLIVWNALGDAGLRDRGVDARTGTIYPGTGLGPRGSAGWVLVGIVLIGVGVLVLVV